MIYLSPPQYNLQQIFKNYKDSGYQNVANDVTFFEKEIKKTLATDKYPLALQSGTAALHLALLLSGVTTGDYVLCQSFSFAASANPIKYLGANPVFIDSNPHDWNICPELLEDAIFDLNQKGIFPKVLVVTHLYGRPAQMTSLLSIAKKHSILLIEDAAEALGSKVESSYCGALGDFGVLSFNYNKIVSTGGGGILVCPNEETYVKARFFATQAKEQKFHYWHKEIGYNYLMPHINAVIGTFELQFLQKRIAERALLQRVYEELIADRPRWSVFEHKFEGYAKSNHWLINLFSDNVLALQDIIIQFKTHNIEVKPLWKPLHTQPVFSNSKSYINGVSENLFSRGICVPSAIAKGSSEISHVSQAFKQIL